MTFPYRHVWIIGASTGLGAALANLLAKSGCLVSISARSIDKLNTRAVNAPHITAYPMDVTASEDVAATHTQIEQDRVPVDLVVFSAGVYRPMSAETFDLESFATQVNTNLLGAANTLNAILPPMLDRGAGKIAIVASVAGYRGLPLAVAYGPTKAALNNMCEALRFDLEPKGIAIQVINPGFVETPLTEQNTFRMPHLMPVDKAARKLMRGLASNRFEVTFPWQFTQQLKLLRVLPRPIYYWLVRRSTKR
jgi:short-subunit dehydrogenase